MALIASSHPALSVRPLLDPKEASDWDWPAMDALRFHTNTDADDARLSESEAADAARLSRWAATDARRVENGNLPAGRSPAASRGGRPPLTGAIAWDRDREGAPGASGGGYVDPSHGLDSNSDGDSGGEARGDGDGAGRRGPPRDRDK